MVPEQACPVVLAYKSFLPSAMEESCTPSNLKNLYFLKDMLLLGLEQALLLLEQYNHPYPQQAFCSFYFVGSGNTICFRKFAGQSYHVNPPYHFFQSTNGK